MLTGDVLALDTSQINNGFIKISPATNVQGDGAASIVFKVEDTDGQQSSSKTLTYFLTLPM